MRLCNTSQAVPYWARSCLLRDMKSQMWPLCVLSEGQSTTHLVSNSPEHEETAPAYCSCFEMEGQGRVGKVLTL